MIFFHFITLDEDFTSAKLLKITKTSLLWFSLMHVTRKTCNEEAVVGRNIMQLLSVYHLLEVMVLIGQRWTLFTKLEPEQYSLLGISFILKKKSIIKYKLYFFMENCLLPLLLFLYNYLHFLIKTFFKLNCSYKQIRKYITLYNIKNI